MYHITESSSKFIVIRITYAKKKDKTQQITFVKDENGDDDAYKSHKVHVPSGEAPNSVSRPPAKRKPGVVRPITQGKLLRKGGPSSEVNKDFVLLKLVF